MSASGVRVKICGLRDRAGLDAACAAGAAYVGFVFFLRSPRHLDWDAAAALAVEVPPGVVKVALAVDPDDAQIDRIAALPVDMLQLHGRETPERAAALRARIGLPVMKAVSVATRADVAAIAGYEPVVDQILVDARPPADAPLPGGTGLSFDWRLIAGRRWSRPWMLAGGLHEGNVAEAIATTGARQVDVSSGVERAPGEKDPERVARFIAAAKAAPPALSRTGRTGA